MGCGAARLRGGVAERGRNRVASPRSLKSVGPNATLVGNDLEGAIATEAGRDGEIEVAGLDPRARSLTALGPIDEYRIYLHPVVLGQGRPISPALGRHCAWWPTIGCEDVIRPDSRSCLIRDPA